MVGFRLADDHVVVEASGLRQGVMRASLYDAAVCIRRIRSARRTVERRLAMTKVVRPARRVAMEAWVSCSRSVSRLLVASSGIRTCGLSAGRER